NGAGKTTLFHLVSGLLRPTAGHVVFRGADISDVPEPARCLRGISRTFQITSLFGELSAVENVRMAIQLKRGGNFVLLGGRSLLAETERLARETLGFLGLHGRSEVPAGRLPHGEQRLLEIAMALAQEPVLLLLDEPTQGLSSAETAATVAVIRRIAHERHLTILLVEHDMDVVFNLADRVTVLNFGQVIAEGVRPRFGPTSMCRRPTSARLPPSSRSRNDDAARSGPPRHVLRQESRPPRPLVRRPARPDHDAPRAERHGKDDDAPIDHGPHATSERHHSLRRPRHHRAAVVSRRAPRSGLRSRGTPALSAPRRRREPATRGAVPESQGALDPRRALRVFPDPPPALAPEGEEPVGR